MRDWKTARLDDVADIRISNVDKKSVASERPVRLCNYMDVYGNDYIDGRLAFMEATASQAEIERFRVQCGDVLITKDSETPDDIGIPAVMTEDVQGLVAGYHLALIRPRRDRMDSVYLAKQLSAEMVVSHFSRRAAGSTRYGLSTSTIASTPILVAPLPMQRRIAEILSMLDGAIEQTEALVKKLRHVKSGLMQDLLTRGLASNGTLRAPVGDKRHHHSHPTLGWIPKDWSAAPVCDFGSVTLGRQRSPDKHSGLWTTPYLRVANVFDGFIDYSDILEMDFTPAERNVFSLKFGDILLNEGQSLELVGRSALFEGDADRFCFQNTLVRFRVNAGNSERFFSHLFKWFLDRGVFARIAKQTTSVAHLGADRFARLICIAVPPNEQTAIAERLDESQRLIRCEEKRLMKLQQQRQGLMHDLLSGRVSVAGLGA